MDSDPVDAHRCTAATLLGATPKTKARRAIQGQSSKSIADGREEAGGSTSANVMPELMQSVIMRTNELLKKSGGSALDEVGLLKDRNDPLVLTGALEILHDAAVIDGARDADEKVAMEQLKAATEVLNKEASEDLNNKEIKEEPEYEPIVSADSQEDKHTEGNYTEITNLKKPSSPEYPESWLGDDGSADEKEIEEEPEDQPIEEEPEEAPADSKDMEITKTPSSPEGREPCLSVDGYEDYTSVSAPPMHQIDEKQLKEAREVLDQSRALIREVFSRDAQGRLLRKMLQLTPDQLQRLTSPSSVYTPAPHVTPERLRKATESMMETLKIWEASKAAKAKAAKAKAAKAKAATAKAAKADTEPAMHYAARRKAAPVQRSAPF